MPLELQVTCIRKRPNHHDPHHRIEGIGGRASGTILAPAWYHAEDEAIRNIEAGTHVYRVTAGGRSVRVIVAQRGLLLGRKYLKTEADGELPNNLLSLPECS